MRLGKVICCAMFLVGGLLALGSSPGAKGAGFAEEDLGDLVQGILSRAEAVFSARMEYKQQMGFGIPPKFYSELELKASFSGSSYVTRNPSLGGGRTSHNDKLVSWIPPNPQNGARAQDYLTVKRPEAIDANYPPAVPYFAGTFWFKNTCRFVRNHQHEVVGAGSGEVNGVPVTILEWPVSKALAFEAFFAVDDWTKNGGTLRLFVAQQLGHVLPRVEFQGVGGVSDRFDAADFVETAPGIFIPKRFSQQSYGSNGPGHNIFYEITRVAKVNDAIPEEDFVFQVPRGAHVSDQRSMVQSEHFRIGEDQVSEPKDLGDLIRSVPSSKGFTSWFTAIAIGVAVGVLLIGLYYLTRRRARRLPS